LVVERLETRLLGGVLQIAGQPSLEINIVACFIGVQGRAIGIHHQTGALSFVCGSAPWRLRAASSEGAIVSQDVLFEANSVVAYGWELALARTDRTC